VKIQVEQLVAADNVVIQFWNAECGDCNISSYRAAATEKTANVKNNRGIARVFVGARAVDVDGRQVARQLIYENF
jgi:hypothetical protein